MSDTSVLPVAVDAFGGDNAPRAIVEGCRMAADESGIDIALVGRASELAPLAGDHPRLTVVDAPEVIGMAEHPSAAVRQKKNSSLVRACSLVAEGRARAVVSAGNSGAMLAASLLVIKRLPGVSRPAIGASLPRTGGGTTFLLDVGANSECKPEWLAQFGIMGSAYAATVGGVADPVVSLVSNGEEEGKGTPLVAAARMLLEQTGLHLGRNVEGKDLFSPVCDVAVCDGFTGNVIIKCAEGVGEFLFRAIKREATATALAKLGALLLKPRLQAIRSTVDYRTTGGALLLGVAGEVVIAHGRSDEIAIAQAVRVADDAARRSVSGAIAAGIAAHPAVQPAHPVEA